MLLEKSGHARAECGSTEVGNGQFTGSAPMKPTCGCAAQETANVAQSYAEVARRRARLRAVSCGFGLNPLLPGRGTLPSEAFGGRDRWITEVTSWNPLLSGDAARKKTKDNYASACQSQRDRDADAN